MVRPLWKLGTLAHQTLNKPNSRKLLSSPGQAKYHSTYVEKRPLTDDEAVQAGFFRFLVYTVFGAMGWAVGASSVRGNAKSEAKEVEEFDRQI